MEYYKFVSTKGTSEVSEVGAEVVLLLGSKVVTDDETVLSTSLGGLWVTTKWFLHGRGVVD